MQYPTVPVQLYATHLPLGALSSSFIHLLWHRDGGNVWVAVWHCYQQAACGAQRCPVVCTKHTPPPHWAVAQGRRTPELDIFSPPVSIHTTLVTSLSIKTCCNCWLSIHSSGKTMGLGGRWLTKISPSAFEKNNSNTSSNCRCT